jgi:hypothetical protein
MRATGNSCACSYPSQSPTPAGRGVAYQIARLSRPLLDTLPHAKLR